MEKFEEEAFRNILPKILSSQLVCSEVEVVTENSVRPERFEICAYRAGEPGNPATLTAVHFSDVHRTRQDITVHSFLSTAQYIRFLGKKDQRLYLEEQLKILR